MNLFLRAKIKGEARATDAVVFEPALKGLEDQGLSSPEPLLSVDEEGSLLVPVQNFRQSLV